MELRTDATQAVAYTCLAADPTLNAVQVTLGPRGKFCYLVKMSTKLNRSMQVFLYIHML